MFRGQRVAVVVPAFDEARLVGQTLRTMPPYVDTVFVVDDASRDDTAVVAAAVNDARIEVLRHPENRGVGGAIVTGYRAAIAAGVDLVAVMAADNQMHPDDLAVLLDALLDEGADYAKGNRFAHEAVRQMPRARRIAGSALALLTRLATGLSIDDSQCGFTIARTACLRRLDLDDLWPRYGYPNDLLALLAASRARVVEAPVRPVYADERSGVRPWHALSIAARIGWRWYRLRAGSPFA